MFSRTAGGTATDRDRGLTSGISTPPNPGQPRASIKPRAIQDAVRFVPDSGPNKGVVPTTWGEAIRNPFFRSDDMTGEKDHAALEWFSAKVGAD
jgi:hypothetical protein